MKFHKREVKKEKIRGGRMDDERKIERREKVRCERKLKRKSKEEREMKRKKVRGEKIDERMLEGVKLDERESKKVKKKK